MKCDLIFYNSRKTAFCEKSLKKSLPQMNMFLDRTAFATDTETLKLLVLQCFDGCDAIFVVGGLGKGDRESSERFFAESLCGCAPDGCKKLRGFGDTDGYLFSVGGGLIVLLPDEPEQIEHIMSGALCDRVKSMERNAEGLSAYDTP